MRRVLASRGADPNYLVASVRTWWATARPREESRLRPRSLQGLWLFAPPSSTAPHPKPGERETLCSVNHPAMSGRTHGVSLPLGTMEDHKARFRCCPERSGTWRKSVLIGGTWQRTKVACEPAEAHLRQPVRGWIALQRGEALRRSGRPCRRSHFIHPQAPRCSQENAHIAAAQSR